MTFLQLCQRLRQEASVSGAGPTSVIDQRGEMQRLINWTRAAYTEILGKWQNWDFLWRETDIAVSAVSATPEMVALPGDFGRVARDSNGAPLVRFGDRDLVEMPFRDYRASDYPAASTPVDFFLLPYNSTAGRRLRLAPTPSADGTVYLSYYAAPSHELVNNGDVPWIPPEHHEVILWRALMMYANYESASELLQQAGTNYGEAMAQLEAAELPEADRFRSSGNSHDVVEVY